MTDLDKMVRDIFDSFPDAAFGIAADFPEYAYVVLESEAYYAIRAALLTAPPGYVLVPVDERQWTDEMRDAGRAAVMAAQCANKTWTPRRHFEAAGQNTNGIPEDVLDERGPLTKESIAVMVMGAMLAAAPEVK